MEKIKLWWKHIFKGILFSGGSFALGNIKVVYLGFLIYSMYNKSTKSLQKSFSTNSRTSLNLKREISEVMLQKIVKKIKNKIVILYANKFDCLHKYFEQEFWGYLHKNEEHIFDEIFQAEIQKKNLTTHEEIENFKKKYCETLFDQIKEIQKLKIFNAGSFTTEILMKYEIHLINSFNYSIEEYVKSLQIYVKTNKYSFNKSV